MIAEAAAFDESLPTAFLVRFGFPPIEDSWDGAAYAEAAETLGVLYTRDPRQLPRHGSPRSGDAFARIVSPENLAALTDPGYSESYRVREGGAQHNAIQRILLIYLEPAREDRVLDEELARIIGVYLYASRHLWPLLEGTLSLPTDPETRDRRVQAVAELEASFSQIVLGACDALEHFSFGPSARHRLASSSGAHVPAITRTMTSERRTQIGAKLTALARSEKDPAVLAELERTIAQW